MDAELAVHESATECCAAAEVRVRETVTVFVAPPPFTVKWPVDVAAFSPATEGLTWSAEGAVPELGENISQGWSLAPVKVSDPPPVLLILTPACVGEDAPA